MSPERHMGNRREIVAEPWRLLESLAEESQPKGGGIIADPMIERSERVENMRRIKNIENIK